MARWEGTEVQVELPRVVEAHVRIVGGEVAVTAASGQAKVDARVVHGQPLHVEVDDGILTVVHEPERLVGGLGGRIRIGPFSIGGGTTERHEAVVVVTVPPDTPITLRTVSGEAVVAGLRAGASITTVSGRITATDVAGDIGLRSVSGAIEAESVDGPVSTNVVSGDVTITGRVPRLTGHSVSGGLTFDLDVAPETSLSTVSGDVVLRLPSDASLRVDLTTMSGTLDSAFPVDGTQTKRRLSGRVGDAARAPSVGVRTMSGDVAILRKERATAAVPSGFTDTGTDTGTGGDDA
jgi:hypothetical protein